MPGGEQSIRVCKTSSVHEGLIKITDYLFFCVCNFTDANNLILSGVIDIKHNINDVRAKRCVMFLMVKCPHQKQAH